MHKRILIFLIFNTLTTHASDVPSVLRLMHHLTIKLGYAYDTKHINKNGSTSGWDDKGCLLCLKVDDYADLHCKNRDCGRGCHETCLQTFWTKLMEKSAAFIKESEPTTFPCPFCSIRYPEIAPHSTDDFLLMATELFEDSFPTQIASLKHIFSPVITRDKEETVAACQALLWEEEKLDNNYYWNKSYWHRKSLCTWGTKVHDVRSESPVVVSQNIQNKESWV